MKPFWWNRQRPKQLQPPNNALLPILPYTQLLTDSTRSILILPKVGCNIDELTLETIPISVLGTRLHARGKHIALPPVESVTIGHTISIQARKIKSRPIVPLQIVTMFKHETDAAILRFIEYYKCVGIERFILYYNDTPSSRSFEHLQSESVEILYFPCPYKNPLFDPARVERNCFNFAQEFVLAFAAYEHFPQAQYTLLIDLDEFIAPLPDSDGQIQIRNLLPELEGYDSIRFSNAWCKHVPEGILMAQQSDKDYRFKHAYSQRVQGIPGPHGLYEDWTADTRIKHSEWNMMQFIDHDTTDRDQHHMSNDVREAELRERNPSVVTYA
jgi:hypothetical protein